MIDIEKLEQLPKRANVALHYSNREYGWDGRYYHNRFRKVYREVSNILKKYLNKNVDKAYSEFCKRISASDERIIFFEELGTAGDPWRKKYSKYYLEGKIIRKRKKKKYVFKPKIFYSWDYEEAWQHRMHGTILSELDFMIELGLNRGDWIKIILHGSSEIVYSLKRWKQLQRENIKSRNRYIKKYYGK